MIYLKHENDNGITQEIEIYSDQIYSRCTKCNEEIEIDIDFLIDILKDGDFSCSISHVECESPKPKLYRIK